MKKLLLTTLLFAFISVGQLFAKPIDIKTAQSLGESYVRSNMASLRNFQTSKHILTINDEKGNACMYIFNVEDRGFYIVSADDRAKPILAYSDEGALDIDNIPPSMSYYLEHYKNAISYAIENNLETESEIRDEWNLLKTRAVVTERNLGKSVDPLVDLTWNQVYPYNYFCPTEKGGPNGHAFVGCAADAMAMIMKYWNYPETGTDKHSYIPEGYPIQTVNFGETTYQWNKMPKNLLSTSPIEEIEAVALLMYHCGVSIDMKYGPTASSGYSEMVPSAMKKYFRYTDRMRHLYRDDYSKTEWENFVIENLDQGFPVFYAGTSQMSGGHAFLCDGYTEDRYFHFNWGWSGVSNGNFAIDALSPPGADYNVNQRAIFDMIPDYAYAAMSKAPVIEAVTNSAYSYSSTINVFAPTESESGEQLESIDKIVVLRNDKQVCTFDNVTPGTMVSFEDEVEDYGVNDYSAYAVCNGVVGRRSHASLFYGSTCSWDIIASTTSFQGWNGASLKILSGQDVFEEITVNSSSPVNKVLQMPEGEISFVWSAPKIPLSSITIIIKNSSDEVVYEYSGTSNALAEGTVFSDNNECENCKAPENLYAQIGEVNGETGVSISWDKTGNPQSYRVYRSDDNEDYQLLATVPSSENQYFDDVNINGIYYYQVTAYNDYCESMPAVTSDLDIDYVFVDYVYIDENNVSAIVYPNPTAGGLNIKSNGMKQVAVFDLVGQKLMEKNVETDELSLDISRFEKGVYMLRIITEEGETTQRIMLAY